ncbi:MAG: hypothetical protein K2X82_27170 [Gemmataceae bacterium]|nr:hypothetical protein [Gemmataceae bacterium]
MCPLPPFDSFFTADALRPGEAPPTATASNPPVLPPGPRRGRREGRRPPVGIRGGGRAVLDTLSRDGTKNLKPAAAWHGEHRDAGLGAPDLASLTPGRSPAAANPRP